MNASVGVPLMHWLIVSLYAAPRALELPCYGVSELVSVHLQGQDCSWTGQGGDRVVFLTGLGSLL